MKNVSVSQMTTTSSVNSCSAQAAVKILFAIAYQRKSSLSFSIRCSTPSSSNALSVSG